MEITKTREEWRGLLLALKTTVEGLLSMPCAHVWSVYGGLQRVTSNVHDILSHKLIASCPQSIYDRAGQLWKVVRGLKYLDPVLSPSIDKIARDDTIDDEGLAWVEQSLLSFTLASQILTLLQNQHYLRQYYSDSAFILQADYTSALITCLQAIEYNRAALLADIDPHLLSKKSIYQLEVDAAKPKQPPSPIKGPLSPVTSPVRKKVIRHHNKHECVRKTHTRSASLPQDWFSEIYKEEAESEMGRRNGAYDRLAPPLLIPTNQNNASLSQQYATADSFGSSSDESARDALIQVLHNSGESLDEIMSRDVNNKDGAALFNNKELLLNNVPIVPLTKDNSLSTKYSTNITHASSFSHRSPVLKLKQRKNQNSTVITRAVSAEVLNKILNDDETELDLAITNGQLNTQENGNSTCDVICDNETNQDNAKESSTVIPPVPSYSVEHITTQPDINELNSSVPTTPIESPDSGYSAFSKNINEPKDTLETPASSIPTESAFNRKSSHYRSRSDYGVPQASGVNSQSTNQNNSNRSSSVSDLPAKQEYASPSTSASTSFFHQPQQGESLIGFLSSQDFHTAAELDKENAHFSICETLIAAIEQMKFSQVLNPPQTDDVMEGDSDEEIQQWKQCIRMRRSQRIREKARGFPAFFDEQTNTTTTSSQSQEVDSIEDYFKSEDEESSNEESQDEEVIDTDISVDTGSNLQSLQGLSMSMASLYSDAELQRSNALADQQELKEQQLRTPNMTQQRERSDELGNVLPDGTLIFTQSVQVSAENVAIALLRRFSAKQLPKASELEWLVSEQDAPQQLLPLPDSYPVSPDDNENADLLTSGRRTRLRGNLEWAPPRAQIIFNVHSPPTRKILLASQNYRCAGCGTKVQREYIKRYRYCEYLGKYFCPCCHSNDLAYIPGRVIRKWDFTKYPVSHFARDLLAKIENEPLFSVEDLNPSLYKKVRSLEQIRDYRKQLTHLTAFLKTCRLGQKLMSIIDGEPSHWTIDPHIYTLRELINVKKNLLLPRIRALSTDALNHVEHCELCQAKGFLCEMCHNSAVIFPFDLENVKQCDLCRACYHSKCFIPGKCPKCTRIELRRLRLNEDIAAEEE